MILLTSEPGLGLAVLRLGARLDRLSSSGTCEESIRGDPCCGPLLLRTLLGEFLEQAGPLRLNFLGGTALLTSCLHSRAEIP